MNTVVDDGRRLDFRALGTGCVLEVTDAARLDVARRAVDERLAAVDAACSRFREDSELEAVNRGAGGPVPVGPDLLAALDVALRASRLTDGDLDPTIGAALRILGYDDDFARVASRRPDAAPAASAGTTLTRIPGWKRITVDPVRSTVAIPAGAALDLGATAKAWAADCCAEVAAERAGCGVLVSLGGDIATAGEPPEQGWAVRIAESHASPPDAPGQTVTVRSGGLATSSTTVRRWSAGGRIRHHIIDPATLEPADDVWRLVSVAAASCTDANIASTAAIIRGERAPAWLTGAGLPARLVHRDGHIVHLNGWPSAGEQP